MIKWLKTWFVSKPPMEFHHPEFGVLTFDAGLWSGVVRRDGRDVPFHTGGSESAPDAGLLRRVRDVLDRFPDVEREALDFLRSQSPGVSGAFTLYALDFLWEDKPHLFALEFSLAGDDDGIWRVEFDNGVPKHVGRDD